MAALTSAQRREFADNGFVVIPGFFSEEEVRIARRAYERVWEELPDDVVVDTEVSHRRILAKDLTEEERSQPFKVNDLYLTDESLRSVIMSDRIGPIIAEILEDVPAVCNTLSMEFGSQQADHLDTLFMTPPSYGKLAATWMALEDVREGAGPLRYFPESNHIEPYRFESGGFHVVESEMDRWADYMAGEVDRHGLEETRFLARAGDLFVWDAWLLHGGSEITDTGLTRNSLVTHFLTKTDLERVGGELCPAPGGMWLRRPPQAVARPEVADVTAPDIPDLPDALPVPGRARSPQLHPKKPLRERLGALLPNRDSPTSS